MAKQAVRARVKPRNPIALDAKMRKAAGPLKDKRRKAKAIAVKERLLLSED